MADPVSDGSSLEWRHLSFGGKRETDWPVEEEMALGERGGPMAWIEYGLARGAAWLFNVFPRPIRKLAVGALARFAYRIMPGRARMARDFIGTALPHLSPAERERQIVQAWKHLFHITLASEQVEKRLVGKPLGEHFELELGDGSEELIRSGEPCLLVTCHLGHWEVAPGVLSALGFRPLYVVGKPPKNRPLSRRVQHLREILGVRVLPRRGAMRLIPTVLKSGGHIALLLDQRARLKPVIAPFFGRPARCDRSAAVLLRRLRVPIVFGGCLATDTPWRFRLVLSRVVRPEELGHASPEEIVTRINREYEALIRRFPDQYFWLHDRYRDAPPAAAGGAEATSRDSVSNQPIHGA